MSYLPQYKLIDKCSQCGATNCKGRKRGKSYYCLNCVRGNDISSQISKAKARDEEREEKIKGMKPKEKRTLRSGIASKVRGLGNSTANIEMLPKPIGGGSELDRWYQDRRIEMTNCCIECGKRTNKINDKYYRWSVCHIVPKSLVPSVAINIFNWVELCQLHHQEFDSTFDKAANMMCFGEVKMKFELFKHLITPQEMRKINPHLLT